ncbi:MAG: LptF/LptG family permease [Nitrospirae bacterium]|nr:LptF/LptG family permease [Nitrospirota bacterium]
MFKIIHRSVLKELFVTFFLMLAFLNSILMMEKILKLSRALSGIGSTLCDMARIILYLQPQLMTLTIPMALLLAPIVVYGRMTVDNEIVILRASGMSFWRITLPVTVLSVVGFLACAAFSLYLGPKSSFKLRTEVARIVSVRAALAIEAGAFNTSLKDLVVLVKGKTAENLLQDIFIYDSRDKAEPKTLMAKEGRIVMEDDFTLGLHLSNGYINVIRGKDLIEIFFEKYRFTMDINTGMPSLKKIELMPGELFDRIRQAKDRKETVSLQLELHRRFSIPLVCLLLGLLAPPLAFMSGKSGRLLGLSTGLMVFTSYYVFQIYFENLALNAHIPHYAGGWMATALFGFLGGLMHRRENSR